MDATAAGVLEMSIWLKQRDVYLLMVCNDYKAATAYLDKQVFSLTSSLPPSLPCSLSLLFTPVHFRSHSLTFLYLTFCVRAAQIIGVGRMDGADDGDR